MKYVPHYIITNDILSNISEIESISSEVKGYRILPKREVELRYRATVEASFSSTSIEGNPLSYKQVEKVLSSKSQLDRSQYAEIEVKNYKKALNFIDKRKLSKKSITKTDVLKIHKLVTTDLLEEQKVGVWRENEVYIENQKGDLIYSGPDPKIVEAEIDKLLNWIKNNSEDVHPILVAAILHVHFVSIHPFPDGNGRTARLLTLLYLGIKNYDFNGSIVLDSYYLIDKNDYYNSLNKVQGNKYSIAETSDLTPWIEYFVEGFLSSAKVLLKEIMIISNSSIVQGDFVKISKDEIDILRYVREFGSINIKEATSILENVPRRTLQRKLKNLVEKQYLVSSGESRRTIIYRLNSK